MKSNRVSKFLKYIALPTVLLCVFLSSCSSFFKNAEGSTGYNTNNNPDTQGVQRESENTETLPQDNEVRYAEYSGSEAEGNLTYTTYNGKKITDFSFLDGLGRDFFSDTGDKTTGSWFCGKTERDLTTGKVTYIWDRAPETLATLDKYGVIYRKNADKKIVYFTFDCGYENGYTAKILDILKEKDVSAAFFLNGHYVSSSPELVRRMLDEGHIVGNHGNNHAVMSKLSLEDFFYEVESVNELMREYVPGAPYMEYFRPSYGSCSEWDIALIHEMELTNVLYSWTYHDYEPDNQPTPEEALDAAKRGLHDGSVMMFHTVGETNTKILGEFIDYIRAEGYEIGKLSDK